ncbi:hypothetical protein ACEYX6_08440 [Acinetobacter sp. c2-A9]|uniref:hypothetical protein n=1 Tax=Acinetobacter sp. c2-A9 TaxID=3342802 RepID=UPI0035BA3EF6
MKMLKVLAIAALATSATAAMANEKIITEDGVAIFKTFKPAQVRAEVGTNGYGGAVGWTVNPNTGIVAGYNGGSISWTDSVKYDGSSYDLKMDNKTAYVNAQVRPFANWFYVAAGVGYLDNDYKLTRNVKAGENFKLNGEEFKTQKDVSITGKFANKGFAPYMGLGFSPDITSRFGVFGEVGAYYTGNPDVTLTSSEAVYNATAQAEANKIRTENKYKYAPVAKLGLTARF